MRTVSVNKLYICGLKNKPLSHSREYVVEHVLREAHKVCIAMSVTLSIAAEQKSAEEALIGAELVQKML